MEIGALQSLNQYLAMCVGGGGEWGGGGEGRLEGVIFYKRFLSRPVNAQFHSHLEITSAKNTLPKYNSAIRPLYL